MNEKFNKNAKVEKFTTMLGIAVHLIVTDPLQIKILKYWSPVHFDFNILCIYLW